MPYTRQLIPPAGIRSSAPPRHGFTLIEMIVVGVLTAIVLAGLVTTMVRQQRFYRGTAEIIDTRSQIRQAAGILPADLRGISTAGGDLLQIGETEMVFRSTIGSSVICVLSSGTIIVPPLTLANGNTLTTWSMEPMVGDTVFLYDPGVSPAAHDDQWRAYRVDQAISPVVNGCPASTGLTTTGDASSPSYSFTVSGTFSAELQAEPLGTPIRFVRTTTYRLYQAGDGNWYLGYCAPSCTGTGLQPVAGPFLPPAGGANAGVRFTYLAEDGSVTTVPAEVAQVSVMVRAETREPVSFAGGQQRVIGDSLAFTVAIRNRR